MDEALRELEAEGVRKKVATSEWAAIVTPVNKDGSVRVCGYFKVTINSPLEEDEYPLPDIDDIYASLGEGHCLTSLTCVTLTYKWRLRSTPGHSSPLTNTRLYQ